jgi:antitoxin FitA
MSTSITIRDVPDETHRELRSRAALAGQSLQEYLREHLVTLASKPDMKTLMARIRERKEQYGGADIPVEKILEYRDADRP